MSAFSNAKELKSSQYFDKQAHHGVARGRFPHSEHLRLKNEIREVYRDGKKLVRTCFVLYVKRVQQSQLKAAFVTGKILGKAHIRNRIRRRLREAFRSVKDEFGKGVHLIFVARTRARDCIYQDLVDEMQRAGKEIGNYKQ